MERLRAGQPGDRSPVDVARLLGRILATEGTRRHEDPALGPAHCSDLAVCARDQGVAGLVLASPSGELTAGASALLHASYLEDTGRHAQTLAVLAQLGDVLDRSGASWAVLKGPVLVELAYDGIARPYSDLDLLVRPADFTAALEALEAAGARLEDRNWDLIRRDRRAQLHLRWGPTGFPIDLHWHVVNRGALRDTFRLPTEELLGRRFTCRLGGDGSAETPSYAPVLDPTDRVIHYALHAATSGGHRLIWLVDIARSVERHPPDWDALVSRCLRWRVELPVAALLARTEETLGPGIPLCVLLALAPRTPRRQLIAWLAKWEPAGRLPGGGSVRRGITRSLSGSLPCTLWQAAALTKEMLWRLWDRYPHWTDPDDPGSTTYPTGGADGRSRYLSALR